MTECSSLLTWLDDEGSSRRRAAAAVGRSAGRRRVAVDPRRRRQPGRPPGETGEVWARAGNFMREYWNKPEATDEVFADGWYHTGDAGYLDEERLPVPRRPGQGHDRHGRRERVLGRGRERDLEASRCRAGRRDRYPARDLGRAGARDRRAAAPAPPQPPRSCRKRAASRSPATRCPSRSSSAPSRCRCRERSRCSNASCGRRTGKATAGPLAERRGAASRTADET